MGTVPYRYIPVMPQSKEVLRHNPLGKVPILVDGGFALYETVAIMNYLGDKYGSRSRCNKTIDTAAGAATSSSSTTPRLIVPSAGTKERGLYDQTLSVLVTELDTQGLWMHRKHEAMGKHFGYIPEAV